MAEFGYALSSEEHGPRTLVENAAKAEAAGFEFLMISFYEGEVLPRLR